MTQIAMRMPPAVTTISAPHALAPAAFGQHAGAALEQADPVLAGLLTAELDRQQRTLTMVAASSVAHPSVLACAGSALTNLTTEGYPGARFHAGCSVADEVERLAEARAKRAFGARFANVQPHSGSTANLCVLTALLRPADVLLGMDLSCGGHLTHGARASVTGRYFTSVGYGVDGDGLIDYTEVATLARTYRPKVIMCGASAYPRRIDFARFRAIADEVGALLVADISHIAGLVAAGYHPSPIDHAHVTTTSTYKQLGGPRGGLILLGKDADTPVPDGRGTLREAMRRAVFPAGQGTPDLAAVAAKARALDMVTSREFSQWCERIVRCADALADAMAQRGYRIVTGGTDNHMVLVDLRDRGLTGVCAERALESCQIVVNRNRLPHDATPPQVGSGLRLGTNSLAARGMPPQAMAECADLLEQVLGATADLGGGRFRLDEQVRASVCDAVADLCARFPLPGYPTVVPATARTVC